MVPDVGLYGIELPNEVQCLSHGFRLQGFGLDEVPPGMRPALCLGNPGLVSGIAVIGGIAISAQGTVEVFQCLLDMRRTPAFRPGECQFIVLAIKRPEPGT